jgi:hypothetical protein
MKALVLAAALFAAPADRICDDCAPRKLCKPHADALAEGLKEVEAELEREEPAARRDALRRAAGLNADHTNAPAREVTELIASALEEDDDLTVKTVAAELLATGQDPDAAVDALARGSTQVGRLLGEVKSDHPDAEAAMAFAVSVVASTASYRDDRSVAALGSLLTRYDTAIYGDVVYRIVDGLTALCAQDGIKALMAYYSLMEGLGFFPRLEEHVHARLTEMASAQGLEGAPAWSDEGVSREWQRWYKKNARSLPKKLGKASARGG